MAFSLAVILFGLALPVLAHDDLLTNWANDAMVQSEYGKLKPASTEINDWFAGEGLVPHGQRADTPCAGTSWVYDYRHHIAAGTDRADRGGAGHLGGMILYFRVPPTRLPNRDLSAVRSVHGLRLGATSSEVARAFHVPIRTVIQLSEHRQVLYMGKSVKCLKWTCADIATVVFDHDHAVTISLQNLGP
jgi:hypothetical protein